MFDGSRSDASKVTTLFCVRPFLPNIGSDLIKKSTQDVLYQHFGSDVCIVDIPALANGGWGGLTARQVYDMNRLADGVVVGGGNLFENGQLTLESGALDALRPPMMLIGLSHGRIHDPSGALTPRSDSMDPARIRQLAAKAEVAMVRDHASLGLLKDLGVANAEMAGCPSLFLPENPRDHAPGERVLLSIRHPSRMSVPAALQWRTVEDVRRLIAALKEKYGDVVHLVCHDYMDLDFAAAFPGTPRLYFADVEHYITALRDCRLNVSYRLHAFLPCLSFGVHAIHLSYDERGRAMVSTAGMEAWNIDLTQTDDVAPAVMAKAAAVEAYRRDRAEAAPGIAAMKAVSMAGVERFATAVERRKMEAGRAGF